MEHKYSIKELELTIDISTKVEESSRSHEEIKYGGEREIRTLVRG